MKKVPKVSVIIPVYNAEKYLQQCLNSILNQTMSDIEIICVDDGSSDSSYDILTEYANIDSRVKVVRQKNSGAGATRNTGLAVACGDYIHFLDSDDWAEANLYEVLYKNIREQNADVCVCFFETFDNVTGNVEKKPRPLIRDCYVCTTNFRQNPSYLVHSSMVSWNKLYSRKLLTENDIWFQDFPFAEDRAFYFHVLICAEKIAIVDEYLIHYRINNDSSLVASTSTSYKQEYNFSSYEKIRDLTKHAPLKVQGMIIDVNIQNFLRFYRNAATGSEEIMRSQLINYILWMNLRLLGDMTEYPWYGEFCALLNTPPGLHHILETDRRTDLSSLKKTFLRYKILSSITFGKTRKRYRQKESIISDKIKTIEAFRGKNG